MKSKYKNMSIMKTSRHVMGWGCGVWHTFITDTLHLVDGLLPILLSQMLGPLHRLAQELLQLSAVVVKTEDT